MKTLSRKEVIRRVNQLGIWNGGPRENPRDGVWSLVDPYGDVSFKFEGCRCLVWCRAAGSRRRAGSVSVMATVDIPEELRLPAAVKVAREMHRIFAGLPVGFAAAKKSISGNLIDGKIQR